MPPFEQQQAALARALTELAQTGNPITVTVDNAAELAGGLLLLMAPHGWCVAPVQR